MKTKWFVILIAILIVGSLGFADDIKGYIIPEYYTVAGHHAGEEGIEGQHGFWIRRIYFGYNTKLGDGWSARVRFEMNSPAFEEDNMVPYIKNAHLKKDLGGGAGFLVGIIEPPSFNKIEKFWGYRFIEKTAPDFFKFASSRDFGAALEGKTKSGLVYTLMYGNFSSNKGEDNKGKAVYGRVGWESETAYLEANGHFAGDGGKDITYLTAFGGLKGSWGRAGIGYHYKSEKPEEGDSKSSGILSGFGVLKLGQKSEIFARYDHFADPGFKDIGGYIPVPAAIFDARFLMAGIAFKLHKNITFSPNVKYVFYGGDNAPDGDFYFNLTGYIAFKTSIGKK